MEACCTVPIRVSRRVPTGPAALSFPGSGDAVQVDELNTRARLRAHVRGIVSDLRYYGVPEENIQRCKTIFDLDRLLTRTITYLMCQQDPRASFTDPRTPAA